MRSRTVAALLLLLALATAPRIKYLYEGSGDGRGSVVSRAYAAGSPTYGDGGESWSQHGLWSAAHRSGRTAPHCAYPAFVAGVSALTKQSELAFFAIQQLLGLIVISLTWYTATAWFGRRAGWFAAFVLALHWTPIYYAGQHQDASLLGAAVMILLAGMGRLLQRCHRCVGSGGGWDLRGIIAQIGLGLAAGLGLGVVCAARPLARFFPMAIALWFLAACWRARTPSLRNSTLAMLAARLSQGGDVDERSDVLLQSLRVSRLQRLQAMVKGAPASVLLAWPGLAGLALGAVLLYAPFYRLQVPGIHQGCPYAIGLQTQTEQSVGAQEISGRHVDTETSGEEVALQLQLLWGPGEVGVPGEARPELAWPATLAWMPVPFSVLHALALLGLALWAVPRRGWRAAGGKMAGDRLSRLAEPRRGSTDAGEMAMVERKLLSQAMPLLLLFCLLSWTVAHLHSFPASVWRQPLVGILALLGGFAFEELAGHIKGRRWREAGAWCASLLCCWLVVGQNWGGLEQSSKEGSRASPVGSIETGTPANMPTNESVDILEVLAAEETVGGEAHYQLARAYFRLGRYDEADAYCKAALRMNPTNTQYINLSALLGESTGQ